MDLKEISLQVEFLVRKAGKYLLENLHSDKIIEKKREFDYVSDIDKYVEEFLKTNLEKYYPDIAFIGEEGSNSSSDNTYTWIVDPLDGTTNYLHKHPVFSISVALEKGDKPLLGTIYQPTTDDLYSAIKGNGSFYNNRKIKVSGRRIFKGGLYGTGFPFRDPANLNRFISSFKEVLPLSDGIRRCGSAALDLCSVAAGYLDGFWEDGLSRWDISAGMIIVREAGGIIMDFNKNDNPQFTGNIIACTPKIFDDFYKHAIIPYLNN